MTLERAIEILEQYQRYLKKEQSIWLNIPHAEITEAIDTVVNFHKKWNNEIEENKKQ